MTAANGQRYGDDVLPLWVADMDFRSPEPIVQALQERVSHGVFGYGRQPEELKAVICERMYRQYNWEITPDDVTFLPGSGQRSQRGCSRNRRKRRRCADDDADLPAVFDCADIPTPSAPDGADGRHQAL